MNAVALRKFLRDLSAQIATNPPQNIVAMVCRTPFIRSAFRNKFPKSPVGLQGVLGYGVREKFAALSADTELFA